MVGATGISVPITLLDGKMEINFGEVFVYRDLNFKNFQNIVSWKIGIPPQQFSVFISSLDSRKKIPMKGKVNFWAISRNEDCIFVVVVKRSKRERRRKNQNNQNLQEKNFRLLKHDMLKDYDDYMSVWINYQLEKMRYEMNVDSAGVGEAFCKDCLRAKALGVEAEFHLCVNDAVTYGFGSSAGPIARPIQFNGPSWSTTGDLWAWRENFSFSALLVYIGGGSELI